MKTLDEINRLIAAIEAELVELESSRTTLLSRAAELQHEKAALLQPSIPLDFNDKLRDRKRINSVIG
jgi:chorismate mutase